MSEWDCLMVAANGSVALLIALCWGEAYLKRQFLPAAVGFVAMIANVWAVLVNVT